MRTGTVKRIGILALLITLCGCATTGSDPGQMDPSSVDRTIETVQRLEAALTWIAPIACSVVAIVAPEALPACQLAAASARALQVVTDQAIAAYRADPSAGNAAAITDVLGQLKAAWDRLDAAYKGDASALQQDRRSCIHPNVLRLEEPSRGQWRRWNSARLHL